MNENAPNDHEEGKLARVVGVSGAVFMGLGSILGTGIFVSIGIAAGITGPSVVLAVALGALVATFNGLSSAQLAASHPVSGGTYEYGHRYLNPTLGFTAGWMFLCAKSASAATAALGFAGYLLAFFGPSPQTAHVLIGVAAVGVLTVVVALGLRLSSRTNAAIVTVTLSGLAAFVILGAPDALDEGTRPFVPFFETDNGGIRSLLHASALMFVTYTGYGRIATLGEEVENPQKSIPRAVIITLVVTMLLYVSVVVVAVGVSGADGLAEATRSSSAPLEVVAGRLSLSWVGWLVSIAAITAMAGVLLNLLLGLSRVLLAMARRGDMPRGLAKVEERHGSPRRAVVVVGVLIAVLTSLGSVKTTWAFSAFTVLVYYALTNLAALKLPQECRRYPRWIPMLGFVSCLGLAFFVDVVIWAVGLGLVLVGLLWHAVASRRSSRSKGSS